MFAVEPTAQDINSYLMLLWQSSVKLIATRAIMTDSERRSNKTDSSSTARIK